jgi:sigma-E factor negative regulatory protein RseC
MIEETGQVVDVEGEFAWIEAERTSTCGGCSARNGCGTGVIARVLGRRRLHLRAINRADAAIGDQVVIGIPESGLLYGSLAVYTGPLLALLGGALIGNGVVAHWYPVAGEAGAIAGAIAGLGAGFVWLRSFSRRTGTHPAYQPVVLRRVFATLPVS